MLRHHSLWAHANPAQYSPQLQVGACSQGGLAVLATLCAAYSALELPRTVTLRMTWDVHVQKVLDGIDALNEQDPRKIKAGAPLCSCTHTDTCASHASWCYASQTRYGSLDAHFMPRPCLASL